MGEHKFKVGDRVMRANVVCGYIKPGTHGKVVRVDPGGCAYVIWDGAPALEDYLLPGYLEPIGAPEPKPAGLLCGVVDGCREPYAHAGVHRLAPKPCPVSFGWVPTAPPDTPQYEPDNRSEELKKAEEATARWAIENRALKAELATHKRLLNDAQQECAERMDVNRMLHTSNNDLKGERDTLRSRVASLETDVEFYRRECVRLGGKARGSR